MCKNCVKMFTSLSVFILTCTWNISEMTLNCFSNTGTSRQISFRFIQRQWNIMTVPPVSKQQRKQWQANPQHLLQVRLAIAYVMSAIFYAAGFRKCRMQECGAFCGTLVAQKNKATHISPQPFRLWNFPACETRNCKPEW